MSHKVSPLTNELKKQQLSEIGRSFCTRIINLTGKESLIHKYRLGEISLTHIFIIILGNGVIERSANDSNSMSRATFLQGLTPTLAAGPCEEHISLIQSFGTMNR